MKLITNTIIIAILILLIIPDSSQAIPAFARKYNMSCNVCHRPFPRLKAFGEDFAANGFQIEGKEPSRFYKKTGDDLLMLMREVPLALRFELFGQYEKDRDVNPDFRTPWILKILSGGNIYKDISYYFYFFLSERGEVAGIEDAFVYFNNVFNSGIGITAGQFQVSDPLFKRELRLELEDYKIYSARIGTSNTRLVYDRGLAFSYGLPTKTDLFFGVFNGNGIGTTEVFDSDKYKNIMFRASQEINKYFRIGGFGYYGKERQTDIDNELWMAGADLTLGNQYVELNAQYVYRNDNNPLFIQNPGDKIKTQGGFAELIYTPSGEDGRWSTWLLYNNVNSNLGGLNYDSYTGGAGFLISRNLQLLGEYTYISQTESSLFTLGVKSAF